MKHTINEVLALAAPVMPVVTIRRIEDAIPIATALKAGGMVVIEVTLRSPIALDAIALMKTVPGIQVGAGTVTSVEQLVELDRIGVDFAVSPGSTIRLLSAAQQLDLAYLPAITTASEIMMGLEFGFDHFKFFPAVTSGGVEALNLFSGPFPKVQFCPTGGISRSNFRDYISLPNVSCVGGSWLMVDQPANADDWSNLEKLAREITLCR